MDERQNEDALSEDMDPSREGERPRQSYPNPTQERIDEELKPDEADDWETTHPPHEGEEGQDIV